MGGEIEQLEALRDGIRQIVARQKADGFFSITDHEALEFADRTATIINQMKSEAVEPVEWKVTKWPLGMTAMERISISDRVRTRADKERYENAGCVMQPLYTAPPNTVPIEQVRGLVEALREAKAHIVTLEETIEDAAELKGMTIAICGATYSHAKTEEALTQFKEQSE